MDREQSVVTPERFAKGMTFDQYVEYVGTPENLTREAGWALGPQRRDFSGLLRSWYELVKLNDAQISAIRWLAEQPNGPAKVLVISEEWSSDCRRDVPMLGQLAEAGRMELRIFPRDGQKVGHGPKADPAESPNADIVNEFLNEKDGQTWQSIPVAVFYTKELQYLYHYTEFPAIYHKARLARGDARRCEPQSPVRIGSRRGSASFATGAGCSSSRRFFGSGRARALTKSSPRCTNGSWSAASLDAAPRTP